MSGYIASAKNTEWTTPEPLVKVVHAFFGDRPDLDPCDNPGSLVDAKTRVWWDELHGDAVDLPHGVIIGDGLALPWSGSVYMNPPYGKGLDRWIEKCARSHREVGAEVVALLPSYTSLAAWQKHVPSAAAVCFLRYRVRFGGARWSAGFASAVVYWGTRQHRFGMHFQSEGMVVRP